MVRSAEEAAANLDRALAAGASVNIYMFHGGTNFGFTNSANHHHTYAPTITSYDYDAPLTESGDPGPKYHAFREVIARHAAVPDEPAPAPGAKLAAAHRRPGPPGADCCRRPGAGGGRARSGPGHDRRNSALHGGHVLYRTSVPAAGDGLLHFEGGVGDRAQVFVDGAAVGVLERERRDETLAVRVPHAGAVLEVLVENQGGVNYGPRIGRPRGCSGPVSLPGCALPGWRPARCPWARGLDAPPFAPHPTAVTDAVPAFHRGFEVDSPADTLSRAARLDQGPGWVNGFHLGRYWNRGPQQTLYVPGPVLRPGANELVLLELHGTTGTRAQLTDTSDLGPVGE